MRTTLTLLITILLLIPSITKAGLGDGLVGYWPLDIRDAVWTSSSVGTIVGRASNSFSGSFSNMTKIGSTALGKIGQGILFTSASSQLINSGDIGVDDDLSAITVCGWAKWNTIAQDQVIQGKYGANFLGHGLQTGNAIGGANNIVWFIYAGSNYVYTSSNPITKTGVWYHVCGTFDNALGAFKNRIYVNGDSLPLSNNGSPDTVTSTGNSDGNDNIGALSVAFGRYFNGIIDDVRIYNRALSQAEVTQLYRQGIGNHYGSWSGSIISTIKSIF